MKRQLAFSTTLAIIVGAVLLIGLVGVGSVLEPKSAEPNQDRILTQDAKEPLASGANIPDTNLIGEATEIPAPRNVIGQAGGANQCDIRTTIQSSRSRTFEHEGQTHRVYARVAATRANLTVNGESRIIRPDETGTYSDGTTITVQEITRGLWRWRVTFCLNPGTGTPPAPDGYLMPVACTPGGQPARVSQDFLGMGMKEAGTWFDILTNTTFLDWVTRDLAAAGVRSVITAGQPPLRNGAYDWSDRDATINEITQAGLRPIIGINPPPGENGGVPDGTYTPQELAAWQALVRATVRRYGPDGTDQVSDWKFGNEPNGAGFWTGTREQYLTILNNAYDAIKDEDPTARVWAPGVVFHPYNMNGHDGINPGAWVDDIIANGQFDVFSIHIYVATPEEMRDVTRDVRERLDAAGKQDVPLTITEFNIAWVPGQGCPYWSTTESEQAENLRRTHACLAEGGADAVYWYTATDRPNRDPNRYCPGNISRLGVFGRDPIREKQSYTALREIGLALGTAGTPIPPPTPGQGDVCLAGEQPLRYNAGGSATHWTTQGAYYPNGSSSLWTSGVEGACCDVATQCAFPNGCQNSGNLMGNYSYLCRTDQGQGVIFGCTDQSTDRDGEKLFGNNAYCCSKYSADYNQGANYFHALPGQRAFGSSTLDAKREVRTATYDACADGSDNDCDGLTDAQDPDCGAPSDTITCPVDGKVFAPTNSDFLGLVGNELQIAIYYNASLPYLADKYADAGVSHVRIIVNWKDIEQTEGSYSWGYTDQRVRAMANEGIDVIGIIDQTPQWASACPNSTRYASCVAADRRDYLDFVRAAVRRYGPDGTNQIRDWEIRVESNSNGGMLTKEQYVTEELNPAYAVIKSEDPDARVWGPEVAFHINSDAYPNGVAYDWVRYTIANGDYDVFSIHTFRDLALTYQHVQRVRQMLDNAGQGHIPLAMGAMNYHNADTPPITQAEQARRLKDLYACVWAAGADKAMWFAGTEWANNVSILLDDTFNGIFDYDFTVPEHVRPKLAYYALAQLGDKLPDETEDNPFVCPADGQVINAKSDFLGMGMKEITNVLGPQGPNTQPALYPTVAARLDDAGVQWTVKGIPQRFVEMEDDQFLWQNHDAIFADWKSRGIRIMGTVHGRAQWAIDSKNPPFPRQDAWAQYVGAVVDRYGSRGTGAVHDWETWNEPNWNGPAPDEDAFEQFLPTHETAYTAVKTSDPQARVWGPSVFIGPDNEAQMLTFLEQFIEQARFDGLSIHLYYNDATELYRVAKHVRGMLDQAGRTNTPLAVTEFRIVSAADKCDPSPAAQKRQAKNLAQAYSCLANAGVDHAFWFTATDWRNSTLDCADRVSRTGVFTTSGATKLEYAALKALAERLKPNTSPPPQPPTTPPRPDAQIYVSPNPCTIPDDAKTCTTTITWKWTGLTDGVLQVRANGQLIACSAATNKIVSNTANIVVTADPTVVTIAHAKTCASIEGENLDKQEAYGLRTPVINTDRESPTSTDKVDADTA